MKYDKVKQSSCLFKGTDMQIQSLLENTGHLTESQYVQQKRVPAIQK